MESGKLQIIDRFILPSLPPHHDESHARFVAVLPACSAQVHGGQGGEVHPEEHEPELGAEGGGLRRRDWRLRQSRCAAEGRSATCRAPGQVWKKMHLRANSGAAGGEQAEARAQGPVEEGGAEVQELKRRTN